ncbi:MAG: YncE family protein, partial [Planctomycetes bacterium]|nr:YncE family protein [Planctomycetota bacterium]
MQHLLRKVLLAAPLLAGAAAADTLVVLNKSADTATLLDPATGEARAVVATGAGPHEVAARADGKLAIVSDYGAETPGRTLSVLDLERGERARTIDLGEYRRPHGLAWSSESGHLLVTAEVQAVLLEVDVDEGKVVRAIPTEGRASHMVAASPDGTRAFVANIASGSLSAIDLEAGRLLAVVPTGAG